jgi:hypothetical protein
VDGPVTWLYDDRSLDWPWQVFPHQARVSGTPSLSDATAQTK